MFYIKHLPSPSIHLTHKPVQQLAQSGLGPVLPAVHPWRPQWCRAPQSSSTGQWTTPGTQRCPWGRTGTDGDLKRWHPMCSHCQSSKQSSHMQQTFCRHPGVQNAILPNKVMWSACFLLPGYLEPLPCFCPSFLCFFVCFLIFLENLSLFKNLFFSPITLRYESVCVCVHACSHHMNSNQSSHIQSLTGHKIAVTASKDENGPNN